MSSVTRSPATPTVERSIPQPSSVPSLDQSAAAAAAVVAVQPALVSEPLSPSLTINFFCLFKKNVGKVRGVVRWWS